MERVVVNIQGFQQQMEKTVSITTKEAVLSNATLPFFQRAIVPFILVLQLWMQLSLLVGNGLKTLCPGRIKHKDVAFSGLNNGD